MSVMNHPRLGAMGLASPARGDEENRERKKGKRKRKGKKENRERKKGRRKRKKKEAGHCMVMGRFISSNLVNGFLPFPCFVCLYPVPYRTVLLFVYFSVCFSCLYLRGGLSV